MSEEVSKANREGWSQFAYEAWVKGNGTPRESARELAAAPWRRLAAYREYLGDLQGRRVANLLGSNGKVAVCMALLGADVTVVDISSENARYANEMAYEAGVSIRYVVSDVMAIPLDEYHSRFDIVIMELGILHWLMDLDRFFHIVTKMLREGGRMIVRDFHPMKAKALRWENGAMVASGNYFDSEIHQGLVPYAKYLSEEQQEQLTQVRTRGWTLGEIVTSIAGSGLRIQVLNEEAGASQRWVFPEDAPEGIEDRLPGLYMIVADRV